MCIGESSSRTFGLGWLLLLSIRRSLLRLRPALVGTTITTVASGLSLLLSLTFSLALFGSLISFYYYLMVLKVIFVDKTADNIPVFPTDFLQRASITLLAAIVLFLGVFPGGLVWKISSSLP